MMVKILDNGLPLTKRFITDHDQDGKAVFCTAISEPLDWQELPSKTRFSLAYASDKFPVNLNNHADVHSYQEFQRNLPGITIPGGTVLRVVDLIPGELTPMHPTVSLDYGAVLEGEVELIMDSGEKRLMKRGDIVVQRGTNHAWRNVSQITWARMLYVLQEATPLEVQGTVLGEDYGEMVGVRPS